MHAIVNIALRAARDAAQALAQASDRLDRVRILQDSGDTLVTSMDMEADATILQHLLKAYPGHRIQSRVSGSSGAEESDHLWLLDPLLGNRNFIHGYPQFAVSIACQVQGITSHAVLLNPLSGEEFCASRGAGAQLDSRRIRVAAGRDLAGALVGMAPRSPPFPHWFALQEALLARGAWPRHSGCPQLDMVQVAAGRLLAGCCSAGEPCSDAAARLILSEAGGLLASEQGQPDAAAGAELYYGGPGVLKDLLKLRRSLEQG